MGGGGGGGGGAKPPPVYTLGLANLCSHRDMIIPLGDHDCKNINLDFDEGGQLREPVFQLQGYQVRK